MDHLTEAELADRAGLPAATVRRLVELGLITGGADGSFGQPDVYRVRLMDPCDRAGMRLEDLAEAVAAGRLSFSCSFADLPHFRWAAHGPTTYRQLAEEPDLSLELLLDVEASTGSAPSRRRCRRSCSSPSTGGSRSGDGGTTRSRGSRPSWRTWGCTASRSTRRPSPSSTSPGTRRSRRSRTTRRARADADLGQLVDAVSGPLGGEPVKWLGDGVMLRFRDPGRAALASLELVEARRRWGCRRTRAWRPGRPCARTATTSGSWPGRHRSSRRCAADGREVGTAVA